MGNGPHANPVIYGEGRLNPQAPIPLYRQLADLITAQIRNGTFRTGGRIPSEHQLAADHGIGRPTARQAVDLMVRKGLLIRKRGAGTFVAEAPQEVDLFSLDGTGASFRKQGLAVETKIIVPVRLHTVDDPEDNPFHAETAICLSRLSRVENRPVLMEDLYLHAGLFRGLERMDLEGRSLSAIADERFYLRPTGGKQGFRIDYLKDRRRHLLEVTAATPVLAVQRYLHFPRQRNGVYVRLWCRTDRFVFTQNIGGMEHG